MRKKILFVVFVFSLLVIFSFAGDNKLSFITSKNSFVVWNNNYFILSGNATVTYKKTTIVGNNFFYDIKNNTFYLTSAATFFEGKDIWSSKKMVYNVDDDKLFLFDVSGESKQLNPKTKKYFKAYYFTNYLFGDQKESKREFVSNSGYFTTCDPRKPHFLDYKIKASKIYIYPHDHLVAYNVIMYIGIVPVYYFPFYYFPLNGNAKQPLDFSYKLDQKEGIVLHIGLNYNLGGLGKDGSVYYNYMQKTGTMVGISQDYSKNDLKFNFKYDIKNTIDNKSNDWFQIAYSQKPWKLFDVNMRFMTSNSSDSSVFNTGKIQKYLNIVSMNQPFKYSLKLSSIQNIKYENPTTLPTSSADEGTTIEPTTTVNDSQILPQITFDYKNNSKSFSLSSLSVVYSKIKKITTTTTSQGSKTVEDSDTVTKAFRTSFYLGANISVGYNYSYNDSNVYFSQGDLYSTTLSTVTETSSSVKNYFYLKHSLSFLDTYLSYEDNITNSNPYKLLAGRLNLKYKLNRAFYGSFSTKFGKTLVNNKYTLSMNFNNNTPYYKFNYEKVLSDIPGLPQTDKVTLTNSYSDKFLKTSLELDYYKKIYNLSYLPMSEVMNFHLNTNLLKIFSLSSKINYDFIKKESISPHVYSSLTLNPFFFKMQYYMNNNLSFYKMFLYSKFDYKNFLYKNSRITFDVGTFIDSNFKLGQTKFYLKYNLPKIISFSGSGYYYPDTNSWNNFLFSSSIFFIPGWNFQANASYVSNDWNNFKLNFVEDLSCWNGFGTIEYYKNNGEWKFKQFTIGLYIKAFPKKPYKLDPVTGQFELGGF